MAEKITFGDLHQLLKECGCVQTPVNGSYVVFKHEASGALQWLCEKGSGPFCAHDLIEDSLRAKFGDEGLKLLPAISEMDDAEKYKAVNRAIATATTLDEVRRACADVAGPAPRRKKGGNGKRGRPKA